MLFSDDPQKIIEYLGDESNAFKAPPQKVSKIYFPENEDELIAINREANEKNILVTVSGGGTGITGSRVPMFGGWVISMEKMLSSNWTTLSRVRSSSARWPRMIPRMLLKSCAMPPARVPMLSIFWA